MSETTAATTNDGDRRLLARGLSWSGIGYPLNVGLLFGSQVLVANLVAPKVFGSYTLSISIFTSAALIAQMGLPQTLLRRASAALSHGDDAEARHEIISAFGVASIAALVCGVILGSPLGEELFDFAFPRTAVATVSALIGAKAALRILENLVPEALRAFRDFSRATIFGQLLTNLLLCLTLAVLLATTSDVDLEDVLLVSAIVSAVALIPGLGAVAVKLRGARSSGVSFRQPVVPTLWLSTVGLAFIGQLDMLVVGSRGTARELALYSAPFRMALLVGLPLIAVNQVVTPLVAGWYAQGQRPRIERMLRATAGLALLVALAIGLVYLVAGGTILETLFGADVFGEGSTVLLILTVGQIVQTFAGSCGYSLIMTGNHRAYAVIVAVSMPLTVALQVVGYELGGVEGVAIATALTLSLQNFAQMIVVKKRAGFSTTADLRALVAEARSGWPRATAR